WDLTRSIQATSNGAFAVNYGTLYPALHRLEARGLVAAKWGVTDAKRRARFYSLTTAGKRQLAAEEKAWDQFTAALGLILKPNA
ncbi:MAG: helix-turn-helix transcriptional regulator, partial [Solirubrobacteraceae bacterium]